LGAAGIPEIGELDAVGAMKARLKQAARHGCRWVVLFGGEEDKNREVVLRDFHEGSQETIPRDSFAAAVAAKMRPDEQP